MVSIKRNLGLFFIKSLVFVSFMGLCCAAYAVKCTSSQAPCCEGKKMSCCRHPGYDSNGKELSYDLSECMTPINPGGPIVIDPIYPIVKECTSGQKEYKPSGSCGTSERTCCSDGTWSDWDGECGGSSSCGTNQCWNGLKCEAKGTVSKTCSGNVANAKSGTLTRTATCHSSGWSYGSWTGTCICNTGYTWNSSSKTCGAKRCVGDEFYNASSDKCCSAGSYQVRAGTNGNWMHVNCRSDQLDTTGECCTMSNNAEFQLPTSAGSCNAFASKVRLSMNNMINRHACILTQ